MIALTIAFFTALAVVFIILVMLFIDSKKEYETHIEKANRNFGFPKKPIEIDRKGHKNERTN